jgi:uncharacterized protein involved in exopolysaccharide biosynthesis
MSELNDDEIDLSEMFGTLWAKKLLILFVMILSTVGAISYALSLTEKYTSNVVFQLKDGGRSGIGGLSSDFSGLAALAGFSGAGSDVNSVNDRVLGRDFVVNLSNFLTLDEDPYFNPPDGKPSLRTTLILAVKSLVSAEPRDTGTEQADPIDKIFGAYKENVTIQETGDGSLEITVTHVDPDKAASIANGILAALVNNLEAEANLQQKSELNYFSKELGEALIEMEETTRMVSDFALENNLGATGEFTQRAVILAELREDLQLTVAMQKAISEMRILFDQLDNPTFKDYLALQEKHAVIDDVDFRRLIGVPEEFGSWQWPLSSNLNGFLKNLDERSARIEKAISNLRIEAESFGLAMEKLETLKREATIAQATYTVLIEHVKLKGLTAGYKSDTTTVFETAVPAIHPSEPKKKLIVALGLVLGAFLGSAIALLSSFRGGFLYTKSSISNVLSAVSNLDAPSLSRTRRSLPRAIERLTYSNLSNSEELLIEVGKRPQAPIVAVATGQNINVLPVALWLACFAKQNSLITSKDDKALSLKEKSPVGVLLLADKPLIGVKLEPIAETGFLQTTINGIRIFCPAKGYLPSQFLFGKSLSDLVEGGGALGHQGLIVASSSRLATVSTRVFSEFNSINIAVTQPGQSQRVILDQLTSVSTWNANVSLEKL